MDILISDYEGNASLILENVEAYFAQELPGREPAWNRSGTTLSASLQADEDEVIKIFEELIKEYPDLRVSAYGSYDVREGDSSAQWWGTTEIRSKKQDGETKIVCSHSTHWN